MKTVKYIAISALAAAGFVLSSCEPGQYWVDSASKTSEKVSFTLAGKAIEYTFKPQDKMEVIGLDVTRNCSTGIDTLFFKSACSQTDSAYVSCADTVIFKDGSNVATLDFKILKEFELGQTASISLEFKDTTKVSTTGVFRSTFKITRDYSWTAIEAKGMIVDNCVPFEEYKPTTVSFEQADQNKNVYRIVDAYAEGTAYMKGTDDYKAGPDKYLKIQLLQPGDVVGVNNITITKSGLVFFSPYQSGWYNSSYGYEVFVTHPYSFATMGGIVVDEEKGKYSKVISYQKDGVTPELVQLAPRYMMYGLGGFDYTGYSGVVYIAFPGCTIKDYGVSVEYTGYAKDIYDVETIGVKISSLGTDVDTVKIAYGTDEAKTLVKKVATGEVESVIVTEEGTYQIPVSGLKSGVYNIVAVTYGGGEAQDYDDDSFTYSGGGSMPYLDRNYNALDLDSLLAPATPEGFVGEYNYYCRFPNEEGTVEPREYAGKVTIDTTAVDTVVAIKGLLDPYGLLADDTMKFDFYGGVLFSRSNTFPDILFSKYYSAAGLFDKNSMESYGMSYNGYSFMSILGFIDKGYLAYVSLLSPAYEFTGIALDAYGSDTYADSTFLGTVCAVYDILLVDPSTARFLPSTGNNGSKLAEKDLSNLKLDLQKPRANLVETDYGYIKSRIDNIWAEKRAAKAEKAASQHISKPVRFSRNDAELVRIK